MYINGYALEVMTKTRLADLRAEATRYSELARLRTPRLGVWAAVRTLFRRAGARESGRKIASPRPA